jgi:methionyl-tRNA synthetase
MKPLIKIDDFAKLDIRVGTVVECIEKEGSDKLLRLTVDFGGEGERIIFSGIKKWYKPEDLKGKQFVFVINLEPRKIMDEYSQGMLLAANGQDETPQPLKPNSTSPAGSTIL